jgi:hypothetical protein
MKGLVAFSYNSGLLLLRNETFLGEALVSSQVSYHLEEMVLFLRW